MSITIISYEDLKDVARLTPQLDSIFFQSSNTKTFASDAARAAFRERWLGRYMTHYPQWFYVALVDGDIAGYLAGCLDDPAEVPLFADIALYKTFAMWTAKYPAHLHVNLAAANRSAGIGSQLVERFCQDARRAGSRGVHVMTGQHARNVGFYARNDFSELAVTGEGAAAVVFLARALQR